jgi:hypothetical protein
MDCKEKLAETGQKKHGTRRTDEEIRADCSNSEGDTAARIFDFCGRAAVSIEGRQGRCTEEVFGTNRHR